MIHTEVAISFLNVIFSFVYLDSSHLCESHQNSRACECEYVQMWPLLWSCQGVSLTAGLSPW